MYNYLFYVVISKSRFCDSVETNAKSLTIPRPQETTAFLALTLALMAAPAHPTPHPPSRPSGEVFPEHLPSLAPSRG